MSPTASHWTVRDIPAQTGRRALITGANSGIGYHTALELARKGAHILLGSRDRARGEAALARLRAEAPGASAELLPLDLASLAQIRTAAADLLAYGQPLDLLINNAGVYAPPQRQVTADGFEVQFGTNVLGHFALTALLFPLVQKASGIPRIVTIASIAHKPARMDFDDLQATRAYSPNRTYQQSKLANLLIAFELDHRLRAAGSSILSITAHPGVAKTALFTKGNFSAFELAARKAMAVVIGSLLNDDAQGAVPSLYAATAPDAVGGGYYGPQSFFEMRGGDAGPAKIAPQALDRTAQQRLWQISEQLTGTTLF